MKILIYSKPFWPMVGGAETYARLLAGGLQEHRCPGVEIEVVVATSADGPSQLPDANVSIVRRPSRRDLWSLIRDADVLMLVGPVFLPLAMGLLARKTVVIEHHGYQACCPNGLLLFDVDRSICPERYSRGQFNWCIRCNRKARGLIGSTMAVFATAIRRMLCRCAAANICITNHVSSRIKLPGSTVIYYGLPSTQPRANRLARRHQRPVVFAYVGRITGEKGLPLLLRAAVALKREGRCFDLRIVGDGPGRAEIEVLANQLNLTDRFHVTGFLEGSALTECLSDVDVVVMPSIWEETAGLAAMEQMMRGRLVIAADVGGLGEVVGDAGLKFRTCDLSQLEDRLREVLDDPTLPDRIGVLAEERARNFFGLGRMIREHVNVFQQALKTRG